MNDRTPHTMPRHATRLLAGFALLGVLAFALITLPGGASAAPGPADLALTKTDSADPVTDETDFSYTIRVSNLDPANDATDVMVTDTLPSQVDYKSATASSGTCTRQASVVTCNLGQVNAGAVATVTIVVKAKQTGTASNTAAVTTTFADANAANNTDGETTQIVAAPKNTKTKKGKKIKPGCAIPTISGTAGNDSITGTSKDDVIVTFDGDDQVFAGGGKDIVCTGAGADFVSGGTRADIIVGGADSDQLFGNTGNDVLKGKAGRDRLRGNADDDFLAGGRGRDNCRGGAGNDTLVSCR